MAFPLSAQDTTQNYANLRNTLVNCQSYCVQIQTATAGGGSVSLSVILSLWTWANTTVALATTISGQQNAVTELTAYMVSVVPGLSGTSPAALATSLTAAVTQLSALITAIQTDYPVAAGGFLADRKLVSGAIAYTTVTAAQLTNTMTAIAAFLVTVS